MPELRCRHFTGYIPCGKSTDCSPNCQTREIISTRILFIHLEALGAVVRSTGLLRAIRRKYPNAHITWITQAPAHELLQGHPWIDRILTTSTNDLLQLAALEFDIAFVVDKSLRAAGVLKQTQAEMVFGFLADSETGSIIPSTPAAEELWHLGLDNHKKFFVNQKSELQLCHEALELGPYRRDPYALFLSDSEHELLSSRRQEWSNGGRALIGINTGCSKVIAAKKLSVTAHREVIQRLIADSRFQVVLLGGIEDTERNIEIGQGLPVVQSPTTRGLRDGLVSVGACDIVLTGDSLGMHMAIALRKWVVAWFGPTCAQEIDLFDRGIKIQSRAVCGPCWKRSCTNSPMCYDQVEVGDFIDGIEKGYQHFQTAQSLDRSNSLFG